MEQGQGRKIPLDTKVYCPMTATERRGNPNCKHDFDEQPTRTDDDSATWKCTQCNLEVTYEVWD